MKKSLLNFIMSFLLIFIPSILIVLLVTYLNNINVINYKTSNIIIYTLSSISFFFFGLLLSIKEKSHGFIRGLILTLIYILVFFIVAKKKEVFNILFLVVRSIALMLGSILGVNFIKNN